MPETSSHKLRPHPPAAPPSRAPGSSPAYAELDVVTNFCFLRGASHPDELVYRAAELGYRAIAITDINSLAGVVRAWEAVKEVASQGPAPKLIVGAHLTFTDAPDLLVYPTNRDAYGRLCRLLTVGKRRAEKGHCLLTLADFLDHQEGLLAALAGPIPSINDHESAIGLLKDALGKRLSLAVSRLYSSDDLGDLHAAVDLSRHYAIPLLATNAVHYHDPSRRALQDVLTCVRHGCTIPDAGLRLFPNAERYLKSPEQMHRLFVDYPLAIRRGLEIAEQVEFDLSQLRYEYPVELTPPDMKSIDYLAQLTWEGAAERYGPSTPGLITNNLQVPLKVRNLIFHELKLIEQLHYEAYFLTVYDIVRFARSRGILCQGRGSAANSAVCFCIGVTSVDPARIDTLFERFISAARGEPPDIDVDFEHERREEVLQYIYEKYGRERAGMTAEVITYRGRSAVRDVGRALGMGLDQVDQMAGRLDWWDSGTLGDDRLREIGMDPSNPHIRRVIDITAELLGFPRHLSQHVGGMVMTQRPLCEMVPIENASMPGRTVIEWDKNDIDALGILKVDCLALGMLTCISKTLALINRPDQPRRHGDTEAQRTINVSVVPRPKELYQIPPEDPAVYEMISNADTVGVFQIESRAQMSMLPRLRPKCFYDLVIEVAIVRPGPIQGNMVHPYLRRRNGEEPVQYPSEALRNVLQRTLGIPLFQEQAMSIAMVGAGFTAEEADQLRRAMAAWRRHGAIDRFHVRFLEGMGRNGYTPEFSEYCFHQIRGFGEYGFPESHAASFALLVYASAWLKHHYPGEFAAGLINSQPMGFYAPAQIIRDVRDHGIEVHPADVNHSTWDCTLEYQATAPSISPRSEIHPALRLGLRLVKGLRKSAADRIGAARQQVSRFSSIDHLHRQAGLSKAVLTTLAEADAFASLGLSRREALWQVMSLSDEGYPLFEDSALEEAPKSDSMTDQPSTAALIGNEPLASEDAFLPPMPLSREVMTDYATTGLSLKSHPAALVREQLDAQRILCAKDIADLPRGHWVEVAGVVLVRQRPATAAGIVFCTIEDETGIANLIIKPDVYERYRDAARFATFLQADGYIERQGQVIHVLVKRLFNLNHLLIDLNAPSRDFH